MTATPNDYRPDDGNPKNQETPKNRGNDHGATAKQVGGAHYTKWAIQPIEFIVKNAVPYREANVIKYTMRHRDKNGAEDIRKAIHYLEMILEDYEA